jgi:hypothetical protein
MFPAKTQMLVYNCVSVTDTGGFSWYFKTEFTKEACEIVQNFSQAVSWENMVFMEGRDMELRTH